MTLAIVVVRMMYVTEKNGVKVTINSLSGPLIHLIERWVHPKITKKYSLDLKEAKMRSSHSASVDVTNLCHGRTMANLAAIRAIKVKPAQNAICAKIPCDSTLPISESIIPTPKRP